MIESANPPAQALWWWPMPRIGIACFDDEREDEDADHDRREAVQDVEPELHLAAELPATRTRSRRSRPATPIGKRDRASRSATSMNVPTIAGAIPPPVSPNTAGPFVKKSQLSAWNALSEDRADEDHEHRDREQRRERRADLGERGSTRSLRRERPVAADARAGSARSASIVTPLELPVEAVDDPLRDDVRDERDREQDQREVERATRPRCSSARSGSCRRAGSRACCRCRRARAWSGWSVLPITCVTAIASPSARPSPSVIAGDDAALARTGRSTPRTISQRVAPRPSEASLTSRGTLDEELAADRRGDRDDHDRQHDDRRRARPPAAARR